MPVERKKELIEIEGKGSGETTIDVTKHVSQRDQKHKPLGPRKRVDIKQNTGAKEDIQVTKSDSQRSNYDEGHGSSSRSGVREEQPEAIVRGEPEVGGSDLQRINYEKRRAVDSMLDISQKEIDREFHRIAAAEKISRQRSADRPMGSESRVKDDDPNFERFKAEYSIKMKTNEYRRQQKKAEEIHIVDSSRDIDRVAFNRAVTDAKISGQRAEDRPKVGRAGWGRPAEGYSTRVADTNPDYQRFIARSRTKEQRNENDRLRRIRENEDESR